MGDRQYPKWGISPTWGPDRRAIGAPRGVFDRGTICEIFHKKARFAYPAGRGTRKQRGAEPHEISQAQTTTIDPPDLRRSLPGLCGCGCRPGAILAGRGPGGHAACSSGAPCRTLRRPGVLRHMPHRPARNLAGDPPRPGLLLTHLPAELAGARPGVPLPGMPQDRVTGTNPELRLRGADE